MKKIIAYLTSIVLSACFFTALPVSAAWSDDTYNPFVEESQWEHMYQLLEDYFNSDDCSLPGTLSDYTKSEPYAVYDFRNMEIYRNELAYIFLKKDGIWRYGVRVGGSHFSDHSIPLVHWLEVTDDIAAALENDQYILFGYVNPGVCEFQPECYYTNGSTYRWYATQPYYDTNYSNGCFDVKQTGICQYEKPVGILAGGTPDTIDYGEVPCGGGYHPGWPIYDYDENGHIVYPDDFVYPPDYEIVYFNAADDTGTDIVISTKNVLYGDVTLDGEIDLTDAVLISKTIAGSVQLNDKQITAADCDANGVLDTNDTVVLLQFLVQQVKELPYTNE